MIVTVTANPILDRTLSVPQLRPGEFDRARVLRQELCGKGITVTRALAALGIPCFACTPQKLPELLEGALRGADLKALATRVSEKKG